MQKFIEVNSWLVSFGFSGIGAILLWAIKLAFNAVRRLDGRIDALESSNIALLGDKIYHLCKSYIKRGWCTVEERRNLDRLFEAYEFGGGNGTAKKLWERTQTLPYTQEEYELSQIQI